MPGGLAVGGVLFVIASGAAGFDAAVGFASNICGAHSPGDYSMQAALLTEVVMTMFFLLIIMGATDKRAPQGVAPIAIGRGLTSIHLISIPVPGGEGIHRELNAQTDPALRSVVELLVDNMEDPAAARAALTGAFDGSGVSQLQLYALGDGEQYSGVEIAARSVDGQAMFLLLLLD